MSGIADTYQFNLPQHGRPQDVTIVKTWYPDIKRYWPNCTSVREVHPIDGIRAVVIHATAGYSSDDAVSVMRKSQKQASFHWLVPDEDEPQHSNLVWACVPECLAAWHVKNAMSHPDVNGGKQRVNHWSLGIEVVNLQPKHSGDPFSEWQVRATALLTRYCWAKYPNLVHVVSHAKLDTHNRSDPGHEFPWSRFKELVHDASHDKLPAAARRSRRGRKRGKRLARGADICMA
jgi:N-acetylmuramoyl-L-alanine amidase